MPSNLQNLTLFLSLLESCVVARQSKYDNPLQEDTKQTMIFERAQETEVSTIQMGKNKTAKTLT